MCARFPRVEIDTQLVVVQHVRERWKPTNTARLLPQMIPSVVLAPWGMREPEFDPSPLQRDDVAFFVLFPREDATELDAPAVASLRAALPPGRRLGFVILDGTWHQCSRMSRRVAVASSLPCVALPPGPPSRWGVRTQHDARGLSTFEAAIRLLAIVEGPERVAPLLATFHALAAALQFMKGKLPKPDVPAEWLDDVLVPTAEER